MDEDWTNSSHRPRHCGPGRRWTRDRLRTIEGPPVDGADGPPHAGPLADGHTDHDVRRGSSRPLFGLRWPDGGDAAPKVIQRDDQYSDHEELRRRRSSRAHRWGTWTAEDDVTEEEARATSTRTRTRTQWPSPHGGVVVRQASPTPQYRRYPQPDELDGARPYRVANYEYDNDDYDDRRYNGGRVWRSSFENTPVDPAVDRVYYHDHVDYGARPQRWPSVARHRSPHRYYDDVQCEDERGHSGRPWIAPPSARSEPSTRPQPSSTLKALLRSSPPRARGPGPTAAGHGPSTMASTMASAGASLGPPRPSVSTPDASAASGGGGEGGGGGGGGATPSSSSDVGGATNTTAARAPVRRAPSSRASPYLTEADRQDIMTRIRRGEKQADLAKAYSVSRAAITNLKQRRQMLEMLESHKAATAALAAAETKRQRLESHDSQSTVQDNCEDAAPARRWPSRCTQHRHLHSDEDSADTSIGDILALLRDPLASDAAIVAALDRHWKQLLDQAMTWATSKEEEAPIVGICGRMEDPTLTSALKTVCGSTTLVHHLSPEWEAKSGRTGLTVPKALTTGPQHVPIVLVIE